jgi:pimeloyl-ACP methyl ester carboxylesterase
MTGGETSFLLVGGARLEYRWIGPGPEDAPTLVFLHEGLGSVSTWRGFPDRLAEAAGCGALVYSRAGYGRSSAAALPRPVRFMHLEAAILHEVLDAAGVREAVLVGHSDGASIALIHAGSGSERVRALVLEAPHVFTEEAGLESIRRIGEVYRTTDLADRLRRHHGDNTDAAFRGWNNVWLHPDFRAWNIEEFLPEIRVPALIIQGEDDEYGTWAQVEAIQRQSGGPVDVLRVPGGHTPHAEHPDVVLEAMTSFVRRILAPRGPGD